MPGARMGYRLADGGVRGKRGGKRSIREEMAPRIKTQGERTRFAGDREPITNGDK